jgi:DNA-binding MarR family transcriptional regulator
LAIRFKNIERLKGGKKIMKDSQILDSDATFHIEKCNTEEFILGRSISMLHRQCRWFMNQRMSALGLGSGQHIYLFHLAHNNGTSQDEISRALELDKATTARAIQKLELLGFVTRKISEKDKRVNHVYLTDKGFSIQDELKAFSSEWKDILVAGMSTEEMVMLEHLFNRMTSNASNYRSSHSKKGGHHDE